jgi:hypothetical protein
MSVPEQVPVSLHTGNGVTTVFAYQFQLTLAADLVVTVGGVVKTLTTDYTISGLGVEAGGDVTFVVAPADEASVVLQRVIEASRATDYQNAGDFKAATVNADFDRTWQAIQGINAELERAVKVEIDSGEDPAVFIDQLLTARDDAETAAVAADASADAAALSATAASDSATAAAASANAADASADAAQASAEAAAATALSTVLTGLSLVSGVAITAADSILSAFGKLQKQITDLITTVGGKVTAGAVTTITSITGMTTPLSVAQGGTGRATGSSYIRVQSSNGYGSASTMNKRYSNVIDNNGSDVIYADSATLGGSYTIVTPGVYHVDACATGPGNHSVGLSLNTVQGATSVVSITAATRIAYNTGNGNGTTASCTRLFQANDVIRSHTDGQAASTAALETFSITGPL